MVVPGVLEFVGGCDPGVTVVDVPLVPGVTHGLTVAPGAAPGVVVAFGVGETVDGVGETVDGVGVTVDGAGDAVDGVGVAVCGVGVAVLPGACVLGEVVTVVPGFAFGVVVVPCFCPAVVLEGLLVEPVVPACPGEACPAEEGVAVCATSVELCIKAVGPLFEVPQ